MKFPWSKSQPNSTNVELKQRSIGTTVSWQQPPQRPMNYENVAREGLMKNEVVWACISELLTSASEPLIAAYKGKQKLDRHLVVDLINKPNPFMTRYYLISSIWLHRSLSGNAFIEKVYNRSHSKVVELWPMRPDRVEIIRDPVKFIGGYKFGWGPDAINYPVEEVIHSKNFSPYDNYYGVGPMQVLLSRVDTDNFMREFTKAFFFNAAVPAGLLNIKGVLADQDREQIRQRQRTNFSGPAGWHTDMVIEDVEATYTPMGMPLGQRGIAYPELDEINEARIAMVFGVPLSLVEARLGVHGAGSYAKKVEDRKDFWQNTLAPMYRDLAETLTDSLIDDFDGFDRLEFDFSTVSALQEDIDKLHIRTRADAASGIITREEARVILGLEPQAFKDDTWITATNILAQGPNEVPGPTDAYPALPPKNPTEQDLINGPSQTSRLMLPGGVNIWVANK